MMNPIEVATTTFSGAAPALAGAAPLNFSQIAPSHLHDRLPTGRQLIILPPYASLFIPLSNWLITPGLATRTILTNKLQTVGSDCIQLLPNETFSGMLQLAGVAGVAPNQAQSITRRLMVCTDSTAAGIPFEALWSADDYGGAPLGFVAASSAIGISVVRDLRLEPLAPLEIAHKQALQMLVVFSNPAAPNLNLGTINVMDGRVTFAAGALAQESLALEETLGGMIRCGLLDMHFLIGVGGVDGNPSAVYRGHVRKGATALEWVVTAQFSGGMAAQFNTMLDERQWHCLHVYAHGSMPDGNAALVLSPGVPLAYASITFHGGRAPRLVVLNACDIAAAPNAVAPAMNGFAPLFLLHGTTNLVAMQMKVSPDTATRTTRAIYSRLAQSLFTRQLDFDEGLHDMRQEVNNLNNPRLDFFCPVLYYRPVNGPIFKYADDRLATWQMIATKSLPVNPMTLLQALRWTAKDGI